MNRFNAEIGGNWFEQNVANAIQMRFPDCAVLHDIKVYSNYLSLVKSHDYTTQIDLILIAPFGIYVIEAKKWGCEIIGNRDDLEWSGRSNLKTFIKNVSPIMQNLVHIRALRNLLRSENYEVPAFKSHVCVPDGTKISSDCSEVIELSPLMSQIRIDQLQFYQNSHTQIIDVEYWRNAILETTEKQKLRNK